MQMSEFSKHIPCISFPRRVLETFISRNKSFVFGWLVGPLFMVLGDYHYAADELRSFERVFKNQEDHFTKWKSVWSSNHVSEWTNEMWPCALNSLFCDCLSALTTEVNSYLQLRPSVHKAEKIHHLALWNPFPSSALEHLFSSFDYKTFLTLAIIYSCHSQYLSTLSYFGFCLYLCITLITFYYTF